MYQAPSFRKQVLQYQEQLHNHMLAQGPQQVPMTPMDFLYSQLMLPANLLSTPSPYINHPTFLAQLPFMPPQPSLPYAPLLATQPAFPRAHSLPMLLHNTYAAKTQPLTSSLEHLNFPRTIILTGVSQELTVRQILDEIDHGPIESVELLAEPDCVCLISFVNTHISHLFYMKYARNPQNLRNLKDKLGAQLEVAVNPGAKATDVLKVKTLNYIMECGATRAVAITFRIVDLDLVPLMEKAFRTRCSKFGAVEEFRLVEDEAALELECGVHFTLIDGAIALYEHYSQRVASEAPGSLPPDDDRDDLVQLSCLCVAFQRDRCDRLGPAHTRPPLPKPGLNTVLLGPELPVSREHKIPAVLSGNRSPSQSISQESLHASEVRLNLKAMDLEPKFAGQESEQALDGTRATLEQSQEVMDLKAAFRHPSFAEPGALPFGSDSSIPASPSIAPSDYFAEHSFGSVYSGFASEAGAHPQQVLYSHAHPASANASFVSIPQYMHHPESLSSGNRTIYLGGLHPRTTVEEIANNVRAGGLVESFKHYQSRRVCFVTFVDPAVALKFFLSHQVLHQLVIRDSEISVNWGKTHSGPLPREVSYAVQSGASRNVYIGFRMSRQPSSLLKIPDEATLRRDFSKFGPMEQINYFHRKECGFMNFLNIADAIQVVDCFETKDEERIKGIVGDDGQFYKKYRYFKISYGKDRCGKPLKFSYVKRKPANDVSEESSTVEDAASKSILPDRIDPVNEEAAYVFGISANPAPKSSVSSENLAESTMVQEIHRVNINEGSVKTAANDQSAVLEDKTAQDETEGTHVGSDSEADDDDDISIIINSGSADRSFSEAPRRPRRKAEKIYHHDLELSDLIHAAYNTSTDSVGNLSHNHNLDHFGPQGSISSQHSFYRPQLPPLQYPRTYSGGVQTFPILPNHSFGVPGTYNSGSQVMAEYLAKSQQENYLYAATMSGNIPLDVRDPRGADTKPSKK